MNEKRENLSLYRRKMLMNLTFYGVKENKDFFGLEHRKSLNLMTSQSQRTITSKSSIIFPVVKLLTTCWKAIFIHLPKSKETKHLKTNKNFLFMSQLTSRQT